MRTLQVRKDDLSRCRLEEAEAPALQDGQLLARIDRFALTANNITYGVVGERFGYWNFFPAADGWGVIPVWGFADVVESRHPEVGVGERLYGYFPMGTHLVLVPAKVSAERCHPLAGPGSCNLVQGHDPNLGATCLSCHVECAGGPATTTTTQIYPHYTITSEQCHAPANLHAGLGHTNCANCHIGRPGLGNVEPRNCIVCHPLTNPGECSLTSRHFYIPGTPDCNACHAHDNCRPTTSSTIRPTTTTTTATPTTTTTSVLTTTTTSITITTTTSVLTTSTTTSPLSSTTTVITEDRDNDGIPDW